MGGGDGLEGRIGRNPEYTIGQLFLSSGHQRRLFLCEGGVGVGVADIIIVSTFFREGHLGTPIVNIMIVY